MFDGNFWLFISVFVCSDYVKCRMNFFICDMFLELSFWMENVAFGKCSVKSAHAARRMQTRILFH